MYIERVAPHWWNHAYFAAHLALQISALCAGRGNAFSHVDIFAAGAHGGGGGAALLRVFLHV